MLHLASLTAKNPPNQRKAPPKKLQLRYFWDFKYTKKPAIKYHQPLPEDICSMYDIIDQRISHHTSCTSWPYWNVEQIYFSPQVNQSNWKVTWSCLPWLTIYISTHVFEITLSRSKQYNLIFTRKYMYLEIKLLLFIEHLLWSFVYSAEIRFFIHYISIMRYNSLQINLMYNELAFSFTFCNLWIFKLGNIKMIKISFYPQS